MKHNEGKKRIENKSIKYINQFYKRPKFQESIIMLKEPQYHKICMLLIV